ncbi:MAG: N4-gp56 family major capsid protein [Clostridiales bacterium 59_14]|nr:MAG: N4-gp56 family major capsid protein [Clostridiales bacterium 59_14]
MEKMNLQLFAGEMNTQTTGALSAEMKTYYGMELLENAKPQLVHNQFAATKGLPVGGGKTVEWRKFGAFDKALTPLTEGVTPDGSGISVSYITKDLAQYGDYTTVSDMLDLTAIDDVVLEITDRHGSNMGLTLDTVTRNEIQQGNQVIYAPQKKADGTSAEVLSRYALDGTCKMTSELVAKAATQLKKMNAPTFDGKYVCIIHPSVAFDLRQDEAWIAAHQYAAATELFSGEIGELHGVRFVETTEAKIYRGEDLAQNARTLTVSGAAANRHGTCPCTVMMTTANTCFPISSTSPSWCWSSLSPHRTRPPSARARAVRTAVPCMAACSWARAPTAWWISARARRSS